MKYWALKTWESNGKYDETKNKWKDFLREKVIAIGWKKLGITLTNKTPREQIRDALKNEYDYNNYEAGHPASTIFNFIQLGEKDNILICRGYNSTQTAKVRLYGTAREIGQFFIHVESTWWFFKHNATLKAFKKCKEYIPKNELKDMLSRGKLHGRTPSVKGLQGTLIQISEEGYKAVLEWAEQDC